MDLGSAIFHTDKDDELNARVYALDVGYEAFVVELTAASRMPTIHIITQSIDQIKQLRNNLSNSLDNFLASKGAHEDA